MKTEKRLTMALSVLVALMMLAVPLASSSNLFVDGGQTNSNGDAPSLSAGDAAGTYVLYFDFNVPENSLDAAKLRDAIKNGTVPATANIGTKGNGTDAKDGIIEFSLIKGKTAQEDRVLAYVKQPTDGTNATTKATLITIGDVITNLNALVFESREGYDLVSWKGTDNNSYYSSNTTTTDAIKKNMNYTANWDLKSVTTYVAKSDTDPTAVPDNIYDYKEFKVNVTIDNETKEYVKAYLVTEDADGNPIIKFNVELKVTSNSLETLTPFNKTRPGEESIAGVGSEGFLFSGVDVWDYAPVYNVLTTDSNKKVVYDSKEDENKYVASVSGDSQNSFNVNFELFSTLTKITISSILFDEDINVYAYNSSLRFLMYGMLLEFLTDAKPITPAPEDYEFPFIKGVTYTDPDTNVESYKYDINPATGKMPVEENKYVLTGWNGSIPLDSLNSVTETSLTLDADVNSYKVIFMVNGEFEVVEVPFGTELSASTTKLDTNGVDHWVSPVTGNAYVSNAFTAFKEFRFSPDEIKAAEAASKVEANKGLFVLIACFQPANKTAYAVFNANENNATGSADFGDELVTTIVIPGEINTPISQLPVTPEKEGKNVFIGWMTKNYTGSDEAGWEYSASGSENSYSSSQEYDKKAVVSSYTAKIESYKWTISFSADGKVIGVLYYYNGTSNTIPLDSANLADERLVAYQYDGKMYKKTDAENGSDAAKDAFANIISPLKAGYKFVQWNDADGKKAISEVKVSENADEYRNYTSSKQSIEKLTGDITVYAEFDALSYSIKYVNAFGGEGQTQKVYVDQNVTLYGKGTFIQEGYELAGWSTVPGAGGDEYKLGGTFVLNGAEFEKLLDSSSDGKTVVIELYSIWNYNGGSITPGDNTDGNDNTALYLIAGMLLVIAVLGIAALALLRNRNSK